LRNGSIAGAERITEPDAVAGRDADALDPEHLRELREEFAIAGNSGDLFFERFIR
jgi:hypothetical protein